MNTTRLDELLDEVLRLYDELISRDGRIEELEQRLSDVEHVCVIGRTNRRKPVRELAELLLRVIRAE